jgi:hypothetical protein
MLLSCGTQYRVQAPHLNLDVSEGSSKYSPSRFNTIETKSNWTARRTQLIFIENGLAFATLTDW